jgi:hypothetical protein
VDILPEEVALKYGYRADQRVMNIVLRRRFRAITTEVEAGMPTAGGNASGEFDFDLLKLNRDGRINFDIEYEARSGILESERDITPTGTTGLFDTRGNVTGIAGGEIDPTLSALVGSPVAVAGVPASAASAVPTLASFVPTAGVPNIPDEGPYRTLVAPSKRLELTGVYNRNLSAKVNATANIRMEASQSRSLLGLPNATLTLPEDNPFSPFGEDVLVYRAYDGLLPLARASRNLTTEAGFSVNGDGLPWSNEWRWSVTGNYNHATSRTVTGRGIDAGPLQALLNAGDAGFNPFAPLDLGLVQVRAADQARSTSNTAALDALLNGPLFKLPAGDATTSIRVLGRTRDLDSSSVRRGVVQSSDIARDMASARANFDLPIASRRRGVLDAIGDLSLNGNVEVEELSDFGTLVSTGYGVNWSPLKQLRLIASVTDEESAPSAEQLGNPIISTPDVRVFDYVRGETALVTRITGGNPALSADSRHVFKLGLNLRPFDDKDFNFRVDYVTSTIRDEITSFPGATAEIEAAFPDRFVRDPAGRLVSIDSRPVNFDRSEREDLQWGFNFSLPLRSAMTRQMEQRRAERQAQRAEAERTGAPPPAEGPGGAGRPDRQGGEGPRRQEGGFFGGGGPGGGGGGRGFGGRGGGGGGGRLTFNVFHTWHLKDQSVIRDGLPVLDRLSGAPGQNGRPVSEHEVRVQAGVNKDGLGVRLSGNWQSGGQVNTGVLGSGERLDFDSFSTLNLRLWGDLGAPQLGLVRKHRWLRGTRVSLEVANLFDARQRVTDDAGLVPLSYQPDLIDPTGRAVRLSVRKLFF